MLVRGRRPASHAAFCDQPPGYPPGRYSGGSCVCRSPLPKWRHHKSPWLRARRISGAVSAPFFGVRRRRRPRFFFRTINYPVAPDRPPDTSRRPPTSEPAAATFLSPNTRSVFLRLGHVGRDEELEEQDEERDDVDLRRAPVYGRRRVLSADGSQHRRGVVPRGYSVESSDAAAASRRPRLDRRAASQRDSSPPNLRAAARRSRWP